MFFRDQVGGETIEIPWWTRSEGNTKFRVTFPKWKSRPPMTHFWVWQYRGHYCCPNSTRVVFRHPILWNPKIDFEITGDFDDDANQEYHHRLAVYNGVMERTGTIWNIRRRKVAHLLPGKKAVIYDERKINSGRYLGTSLGNRDSDQVLPQPRGYADRVKRPTQAPTET